MNNEILQELIAIKNQRIQVFSELITIKDTKDCIEIKFYNKDKTKILDEYDVKNITITYGDMKITNITSIVLKERHMIINRTFEYDFGINTIPIIDIDLSDGYINIYNGLDEKNFVFEYKEFTPDQKCPIEELPNYPLISYDINLSEKLKGFYEITITVRMSPVDEYDYKFKLFSIISKGHYECFNMSCQYINKIEKGDFREFFGFNKIKFNDNFEGIDKDEIYTIDDHHYNDEFFSIISSKDETLILIPYIAVLGAIIPIEE